MPANPIQRRRAAVLAADVALVEFGSAVDAVRNGPA